MAQRERPDQTERRRATILFTDITGFTARTERFDPEEVSSVVWPCVALLDEIARKHGGVVEHYQGDAILATFGVPFAVEDAARAAINAAIEMHNRVAEFCRDRGIDPPLRIHTGIDSGLVVARNPSSLPIRVEFSVLGDAVNTAARLKDLAPAGGIWVGPETYRHTRAVFEFRAVAPLPLKGKSAAVPAYEVVSRRAHLHRQVAPTRLSSGMVGRGRELEQLEERLADLRRGHGGVVRLIGPGGIGKSRLVAELAATAAPREILWLQGRSLSIGANLSFHPFSDLLRGWAGISDEEAEHEAFSRFETKLRGLFGNDADEVLPFLGSLAGLQLPPVHRRRLEAVEGEAMEKLRLGATSRWFRLLVERSPVVAAFEDLHWADVSSLELLDSLLRLAADHAILFVLVQRPEAPPEVEELFAASRRRLLDRHHELCLAPLERGAAEILLEDLFHGGHLPHAERSLITERSAGNPFFLEEIVRALVDEGVVEVRAGSLFATDRLAASVIPHTVEEVILERLDRLPPQRRGVLQLAAIIGRACDERVLARLVEGPELAHDIALLIEAELLVRGDRLGEVIYEFKHPLLQEVTYAAISLERRRDLHGKVARVIERELPESTPGRSAMLAYHFSLGREPERAEYYLVRAGEEAGRAAAPSEALHFLQEAARLYFEMHGDAGDPLRRAGIEKQIGLAFFNRGRMLEGDQHFDRALALLGERVPGSGWRRNLRYGTTLASVLLDLYLGRDRNRRRAPTQQDREVLEMMLLRAQARVTADPTRFLFDTMEGLRRLNRIDPRSVENVGGMYASSVGYLAYSGLSLGIEERLLRLGSSLANADDPREQFLCRIMGFIHHIFRGDWDERHAVEDALVEENLRLGQLWNVVNYLPLDAKRRVHQGRFAEAGEILERIAKIEDLYAYDLARSNRIAVTMYLRLEQRRLLEALAAATEHYESSHEDLLNLLALGTKARIEVLLGRMENAAETLDRAAPIVNRLAFVPPFHASEVLLAQLALDLERLERARAVGDRALARRLGGEARRRSRRTVARATKVAWQRPETHRLVGRCAWLLGREEKALRAWGRSADEAERLGMRPELARTWLEVGSRMARRSGATFRGIPSSACFDRAEEIFHDLGLDWDLERLAAAREEARSGSLRPG